MLLSFGTSSGFGQTKYPINYDKRYTVRVNSESRIGNERFYDVDFLNSNNQIIKSIQKVAEENHYSKKGYDVKQKITYHFFFDTLETYSISVDMIDKVLFKTVYDFQSGYNVGWINY